MSFHSSGGPEEGFIGGTGPVISYLFVALPGESYAKVANYQSPPKQGDFRWERWAWEGVKGRAGSATLKLAKAGRRE